MNDFDKSLIIPFDAPLNKEDTESQTYGCRQLNPDICKNCYINNICAFVSKDKICKRPSLKWKKQYKYLLSKGEKSNGN